MAPVSIPDILGLCQPVPGIIMPSELADPEGAAGARIVLDRLQVQPVKNWHLFIIHYHSHSKICVFLIINSVREAEWVALLKIFWLVYLP